MRVLLIATMTLFALACGGGDNPVDKAEKYRESACACADYECARGVIKKLNKLSLSSEVKELDDDKRAAFKKASLAAADCHQALKGK